MAVHWFCNPVMAVRFCRGAPFYKYRYGKHFLQTCECAVWNVSGHVTQHSGSTYSVELAAYVLVEVFWPGSQLCEFFSTAQYPSQPCWSVLYSARTEAVYSHWRVRNKQLLQTQLGLRRWGQSNAMVESKRSWSRTKNQDHTHRHTVCLLWARRLWSSMVRLSWTTQPCQSRSSAFCRQQRQLNWSMVSKLCASRFAIQAKIRMVPSSW